MFHFYSDADSFLFNHIEGLLIKHPSSSIIQDYM